MLEKKHSLELDVCRHGSDFLATGECCMAMPTGFFLEKP